MLMDVPGAVFVFLFLLRLASNGQYIARHVDLHLIRAEAGYNSPHDHIVIGLVHIDWK
jgi:hypothetical protein